MRLITIEEPGVLAVSWTWLPAWLGMQSTLINEVSAVVKPKVEGRPLTEELLDEAHAEVVDFLCSRFPAIVGLREHLESIRHIQQP
jgi:hypothetical protein